MPVELFWLFRFSRRRKLALKTKQYILDLQNKSLALVLVAFADALKHAAQSIMLTFVYSWPAVWEWCSDWYRPDYYKTLIEKGGVANNPPGPDSPFGPSALSPVRGC